MLRSVADARYFGNPIFAARYVELHSFAAKFSPTVEQTVNDRLAHRRVEVLGHDELLINSLKTAFVWGTPA